MIKRPIVSKKKKTSRKNSYKEHIFQTFEFPNLGFSVKKNELYFHGVRLMDLVEKYGTPMKLTYLPKITENIEAAQYYFKKAIRKNRYKGKYTYLYCTKSSHFKFVMDEIFSNTVHVETSSEFDYDILEYLFRHDKITKRTHIVSNGFKTTGYLERIANFVNRGFRNVVCVLDNKEELEQLSALTKKPVKIGFRLSTLEHPTSLIYNSRLGIKESEVFDFYKNSIEGNPKFKLKMLHFFLNKGITDSSYYWSELEKHVHTFCDLKAICPELDTLDIGGGMKIHESLSDEIDYDYMINEIVLTIKRICTERGVLEPHIFTEFGSYTVSESGAILYSVIGQKRQNDIENWYMIDSSLITTLPDIWGIGQKFILLALNNWQNEHNRINLGGITCDGMDYYNSEMQQNEVFMPKIVNGEKLFLGFFHTGAYQESLGGFGGIQHCLIPAPKHIVINKKNNRFIYEVFSKEQESKSMMEILGY